MAKTVVVDYLPESAEKYHNGYAVVAVDVLRATTTAVTCVAQGRRCFPISSIDAALALAGRLKDPLLVGEVAGDVPLGFHLNNSPVELIKRADVERPVILISSSGTRLICAAEGAEAIYVSCLRNVAAQVTHLAARHSHVAVIGAGTKGEFREEDQLCCAWIAEGLMKAGFEPYDRQTRDVVERWSSAPVDVIVPGKSADYLRRTDQVYDLDFVLAHVDDLHDVYLYRQGEIVRQPVAAAP